MALFPCFYSLWEGCENEKPKNSVFAKQIEGLQKFYGGHHRKIKTDNKQQSVEGIYTTCNG